MANYVPAAGDLVYSGASAATELLSRVGGFIAGCGFASFAVVNNAVHGTSTSPSQVTDIINRAIHAGDAGPGGVATPAGIERTAAAYGVTFQSEPYQSALSQYAGVKPIELGVSNARAFGGADSNVQGHYITIVGRTAQGSFIVSDPNTPQSAAGQFVTYTPAQIIASNPFWAGVPQQSVLGSASGATSASSSSSTSSGGNPFDIANAIGGLGTGITSAVGSFGSDLRSGATTALRDSAWFLLALVIIGAGAWLLFSEPLQQAAKSVGKAARGAAGGGRGNEGEDAAGEGEAGSAGEAAGAEGADVAAVAAV